jgi:hypothetical protein
MSVVFLAPNSFPPIQLSEFGFAAFSECSLCDMKTVNHDEALIDVFYAVTGFVAAYDLPATYTTPMLCYFTFLSSLLTHFLQLPDFDAHCLVWLIEMIIVHLHVTSRDSSSSVMQSFVHIPRIHPIRIA